MNKLEHNCLMDYCNTNKDTVAVLKRNRALQRQEEIKMFGKQISFRPMVTKNKKKYTRKNKHPQLKADFFVFI